MLGIVSWLGMILAPLSGAVLTLALQPEKPVETPGKPKEAEKTPLTDAQKLRIIVEYYLAKKRPLRAKEIAQEWKKLGDDKKAALFQEVEALKNKPKPTQPNINEIVRIYTNANKPKTAAKLKRDWVHYSPTKRDLEYKKALELKAETEKDKPEPQPQKPDTKDMKTIKPTKPTTEPKKTEKLPEPMSPID